MHSNMDDSMDVSIYDVDGSSDFEMAPKPVSQQTAQTHDHPITVADFRQKAKPAPKKPAAAAKPKATTAKAAPKKTVQSKLKMPPLSILF